MEKEDATFCGTLFWMASTIFHFISAASKDRSRVKLGFYARLTLFCGIIFPVIDWLGLYKATAILGSVCFGIAVSVLFPLLVAIPVDYGLTFKPEQFSNIMVCPLFSSMFLIGTTGKLM